jgi:hypothetical protein
VRGNSEICGIFGAGAASAVKDQRSATMSSDDPRCGEFNFQYVNEGVEISYTVLVEVEMRM